MESLQFIILGLVQGLTEFLPVSSSAHLILLPNITGWDDQGLAYDIAAHAGSLIAVIIYFRKDLNRIIYAGILSVKQRHFTAEGYLFWYLIMATVPLALMAYLFYTFISIGLRAPVVIAVATIFFGLMLWLADNRGNQSRGIENLKFSDAIIIGIAQVLALIPGTSRSGITMTAGLMLGFSREAAARFSFLLAIPAIILASGYQTYRFIIHENQFDMVNFITVFSISAISALLAIHLFLGFLQRTGMLPYVIYRLILGTVLLIIFI